MESEEIRMFIIYPQMGTIMWSESTLEVLQIFKFRPQVLLNVGYLTQEFQFTAYNKLLAVVARDFSGTCSSVEPAAAI